MNDAEIRPDSNEESSVVWQLFVCRRQTASTLSQNWARSDATPSEIDWSGG
jgi:hypothetical protein